MSRVKEWGFATAALLAVTTPLLAHHGTVGVYDQKQAVKIEGVVKQFSWRKMNGVRPSLITCASTNAGSAPVIYTLRATGEPNEMIFSAANEKAFEETVRNPVLSTPIK